MFEKKTYNTHIRLFDSIEELIDKCRHIMPRNGKNLKSVNRPDFIGRAFERIEDVYEIVRQPWAEGLDIIERMAGELENSDVPRPQNKKRKPRFSESDGDEIDYDRLRTGRDYWRSTCRASSIGPQTVTIIIDLATAGNVSHANIQWRGAAALAMSRILEDAGFRVEIWAVSCFDKCYSDGFGVGTGICLKRPEDPLDISTLSAAISGWFFRTVIFRAAAIGTKAPRGGLGVVGSCYQIGHEIDADDPIVISDVFSYAAAVRLARRALEKLTTPPPPEPEFETVPAAAPTYTPPAVPYKAPTAAERRAAEKQWKEWQARYERENTTEQ
jgi:hypothetical protein